MKLYNKPVEALCWFRPDGSITLLKLRFTNREGKELVISVQSAGKQEKRRHNGRNIIDIHCMGLVNGRETIVNLHYQIADCKWILHKM